MAVTKPIIKSRISINQQGGTNNYYVKWSLTDAQKKIKIKKKVYNKKKKKKVSTTKKYFDCITNFTIKWYYKVDEESSQWYLDKTITTANKNATNTSDDLWSPPETAVRIKVTIKPNSMSYQSSKTKTAKWFTVDPVTVTDSDYDEIPNAPSVGDISFVGTKAKAIISYDVASNDVDTIEVQSLRDNVHVRDFGPYEASKDTGITVFEEEFDIVGSYQLRARISSLDSDSGKYKWSPWSSWSSAIDTRPKTPEKFSVVAYNKELLKATWEKVEGITQYEIEYVRDKVEYFDSGMVSTVSVGDVGLYLINGLDVGATWYFRIRSVNSNDKSEPSEVVSAVLATKPGPPSTWSLTTTAVITPDIETTEPLYIYWSHNSVDGSPQEWARLEFEISGTKYYHLHKNENRDEYDELEDKVTELNLWTINIYTDVDCTIPAGTIYSQFYSGTADTIRWMVQTKGLHDDYSDWSVERIINAYAKPSLNIKLLDYEGIETNSISAYPLRIIGDVTPYSQTPISYYVSVVSNESYETVDRYGNTVMINTGTEIFSRYLDTNEQLDLTLGANDLELQNGVDYTLKVTAYLNSGLTAESELEFSVSWDKLDMPEPDAMVMYNDTYRYADILPYANDFIGATPTVEGYEPKTYIGIGITGTDPDNHIFSGSGVDNAMTGDMYVNKDSNTVYACTLGGSPSTATWGYRMTLEFNSDSTWYSGTKIVDNDDETYIYPESGVVNALYGDHYLNTDTGDIYRCSVPGTPDVAEWMYEASSFWAPAKDIVLSVYRQEANGRYIAVAEGIDNSGQSSDRAISVRDPHPSFGVCRYRIVATNTKNGCMSFGDTEEETRETSVIIQWDEKWNDPQSDTDDEIFEGSILELPANIELSDKNTPDVAFAEYIGRERPVSYYGTQKGEAPSINCVFEKSDKEKLEVVRRLMRYSGDVYIREPSGLGYWANVTVSYSRSYESLIIPVSIEIRPVEGGL